MDADDVSEPADLYGLHPSAFVAARDALARRLRADGRTEDAAAVKALRRPGVVAWALNQLSRRAAEDVDALLALGDRLAGAQRSMLAGGGRDALRAALAERRAIVDRLTDAAGRWLVEEDVGAPHRDEIAAVLEAATVDAGVAGALRDGRLTAEPEVSGGMELLAGGTPATTGEPAADSERDPRVEAAEKRARRDREAADDAAAAAAEATRARHERERQVRDLEDELADARRALASAERAEERASRAAAKAKEKADASAATLRELEEG